MKKYIKPSMEVVNIKIQTLLQDNSVNSVNGLMDVERGNGDFVGGDTDSRGGGYWDDED
ncbi:MAG: hypothetical protein J6I52_08020 [Prevotella sp.]|nr:hypothetical protein [Prevotella sp.]